ncbi:MAG TPA: response regulator [Chryseolinea sp.]
MVKIFIIDDNEDFVLLFSQAVSKTHPECQCLSAENGYNALRQLKFMLPTVPDFIFVDVKMPIMNGHEIVNELKKSNMFASVPIIMYSAEASPEDEIKAREAGTDGFYPKPSSAEKINTLITSVFNMRKN